MKLKSLLFGSAAAMVTVTGAQAADLPIAEPVEYVRICDAFGTGFFYIPGTETCLKISGEASFLAGYISEGDGVYEDDDEDGDDYNNFGTEAGFELTLDSRVQTDLGIIRAYINIDGTRSTMPGFGLLEDFNGFEAGSGSDNSIGLDKAYIQILNDFGTLTAGQADSFFALESTYDIEDIFGFINGPRRDANLLAYSFAFGNGFSATISLEDMESAGLVGGYDDEYDAGGQDLPAAVLALRVDQGWGSAQLSGAVGQISAYDDDLDDTVGWAVGAGVSVEVPNTMFALGLEAGYADGLIGYVVGDLYGTELSNADIQPWDADSENNTAWNVRAQLSAGFTETVSAILAGGYVSYEDEDGDDDWNEWGAAFNLVWTPVDNFLVLGEISYASVEIDDGAPDDFDDGSIWGVGMKMVKEF